MNETTLREEMARLSRSLFERGYSVGSAGNISARPLTCLAQAWFGRVRALL
jgi:ribulose-5-phosphate 4-epimerase/fuculose-1-phosphate aldolase